MHLAVHVQYRYVATPHVLIESIDLPQYADIIHPHNNNYYAYCYASMFDAGLCIAATHFHFPYYIHNNEMLHF